MAVAGLRSSKASVRKCCDFYIRVLDANKKFSLQIIPPWFEHISEFLLARKEKPAIEVIFLLILFLWRLIHKCGKTRSVS